MSRSGSPLSASRRLPDLELGGAGSVPSRSSFVSRAPSPRITDSIRARASPSTPRPIRRLLRRCLEKDRRSRYHDVADVRIAIEDALDEPPDAGPSQALQRSSRTILLPLVGALALSILTATVVWLLRPPGVSESGAYRFPLKLSPTEQLSLGGFDFPIAISAQGRFLAYTSRHGAESQIFVRSMTAFEAQYDLSATTGGDRHYDVAPDGRRFLMVTEGSASSIRLVLNWFDELNRLAPKND